MSPAGDRPEPADLAEWVRYLRDIGVRELHVASAAPPAKEAAAPSAAPAAEPVAERAVARATVPALKFGGEPPADPVTALEDILRDAWRFHKHHPDGYRTSQGVA